MLAKEVEKRKVIIIGGGFSGLTLAYELLQHQFSVAVFEKNKWGGLIDTEIKKEMQIESAANGFLNSEKVEALCKEIGCEIYGVQDRAKKRFIFREGLRQWPLGIKTNCFILFKLLPLYIFKKNKLMPLPGESVQSWALRVLNQEILDYLLAPALAGIYAGPVSELSASLILKRFFEPQKKPRRKLNSKGTVAPQWGMAEFIKKLKSYLEAKKASLDITGEQKNILIGPRDVVVFATEPWEIKNSFSQLSFAESFPLSERENFLKNIAPLEGIKPIPLVRVTLSFSNPLFKVPGFGVLFPRKDQFNSLGVLANSQIFPNRGDKYNESWILDGNHLHLTDQEIVDGLVRDRKRAFGVNDEILSYVITRWPRAISLYSTGHEKILIDFAKLQNENPCAQFFLTGNYLGKLGLAKILEQNEQLAGQVTQSNRAITKRNEQ